MNRLCSTLAWKVTSRKRCCPWSDIETSRREESGNRMNWANVVRMKTEKLHILCEFSVFRVNQTFSVRFACWSTDNYFPSDSFSRNCNCSDCRRFCSVSTSSELFPSRRKATATASGFWGRKLWRRENRFRMQQINRVGEEWFDVTRNIGPIWKENNKLNPGSINDEKPQECQQRGKRKFNHSTLDVFLRRNCVPAPRSRFPAFQGGKINQCLSIRSRQPPVAMRSARMCMTERVKRINFVWFTNIFPTNYPWCETRYAWDAPGLSSISCDITNDDEKNTNRSVFEEIIKFQSHVSSCTSSSS